uniref:Uncharacterized protein n=1 Tax=Trypanosoma congolense (strain IL3000) TaxID=1068625 RepID=G0UJ63_TRYCI|nr:conserved hypothetical protein [Trypanosoma congolense IL3000]
MLKNVELSHPYNIDVIRSSPRRTLACDLGHSGTNEVFSAFVPKPAMNSYGGVRNRSHNHIAGKVSFDVPVEMHTANGYETESHMWWRCPCCAEVHCAATGDAPRSPPLSSLNFCGSAADASHLNRRHRNISVNGHLGGETSRLAGCPCRGCGCVNRMHDKAIQSCHVRGGTPQRFWGGVCQHHFYGIPTGECGRCPPTEATPQAWYQIPFGSVDSPPTPSQPYNVSEHPCLPMTADMSVAAGPEVPEFIVKRARLQQEQRSTQSLAHTPSPVLSPNGGNCQEGFCTLHRLQRDLETLEKRVDMLEVGYKSKIVRELDEAGGSNFVCGEEECPTNRSTATACGPSGPSTPPPLPPSPQAPTMGLESSNDPGVMLSQNSSPTLSTPDTSGQDSVGNITLERLMRAVRSARERAMQQEYQG